MVVEDKGIIAEHIATGLRDMDYDVCGMVTTGEDALKLAEETHPDLVVMDMVDFKERWMGLPLPMPFGKLQNPHRIPDCLCRRRDP